MTRAIVVATLVLCAGLVGCKTHDELVVDVFCASVCQCETDPEDQAECYAECPAVIDPADVSDACFQCVLEASESCPELFACDPVCDGP